VCVCVFCEHVDGGDMRTGYSVDYYAAQGGVEDQQQWREPFCVGRVGGEVVGVGEERHCAEGDLRC